MRKEVMLEMDAEQLDEYARVLGFDAGKARGVKAKAALIEKKREREAEIDVLGMTVRVPVKRMHDKRITDRLTGELTDDREAERLMRDLIGDEQADELLERCTEEDGTVDADAFGYAIAKIAYSPELKNF